MAPSRQPLAVFNELAVIHDTPGRANVMPDAPQTQHDASPRSDDSPDFITAAKDGTLAKFAASRKMQLHLPAKGFFDNAWRVECVNAITVNGRHFIEMKTLSGETPDLTLQDQDKIFRLPVSRAMNWATCPSVAKITKCKVSETS